MVFVVKDRIKNEADKCPRSFACLATAECDGRPMCEVEEVNGRSFLTLKARECILSCPYRVPLGRRQICTCPVRAEIHRKYGW